MKLLLRSIKVIAMFDTDNKIRPLKFKLEDSQDIIKIDHFLLQEIKKFAGEELHIFKCQGKLDGEDRLFEIAYNKQKLNWILRKM